MLDVNVYAWKVRSNFILTSLNENIIQQQHFSVTRIAVETLKIHNLCEFHEWNGLI